MELIESNGVIMEIKKIGKKFQEIKFNGKFKKAYHQ